MKFRLRGGKAPTIIITSDGASTPTPLSDKLMNHRLVLWLLWALQHPGQFLFFASVSLVFVTIVGLTALYAGYEYVESPEFCGSVCHPMEPQYLRYERSLHAEVR